MGRDFQLQLPAELDRPGGGVRIAHFWFKEGESLASMNASIPSTKFSAVLVEGRSKTFVVRTNLASTR